MPSWRRRYSLCARPSGRPQGFGRTQSRNINSVNGRDSARALASYSSRGPLVVWVALSLSVCAQGVRFAHDPISPIAESPAGVRMTAGNHNCFLPQRKRASVRAGACGPARAGQYSPTPNESSELRYCLPARPLLTNGKISAPKPRILSPIHPDTRVSLVADTCFGKFPHAPASSPPTVRNSPEIADNQDHRYAHNFHRKSTHASA